jgi:lipopolysaccharide biosynthesis glycosyltransferase
MNSFQNDIAIPIGHSQDTVCHESVGCDITVVCACNDKYAPFCGTMITSLFHNNKRHHIEVFILSSDMGKENQMKFEELARSYGQTVHFTSMRKQDFEFLPIGKRFTNISHEAYFRLRMPSLLKDRDKALYLDCDMIVRKDIAELWNTHLENHAIAAIQDTTRMQKRCFPRLGYNSEEGYYNSGMGVYNLSFLRSFNFEEKVQQFIKTNPEKIIFHDQDITNCVCHGLFKEVSPKWNLLESFLEENPPVVEWQKEELHKYRQDPSIIHYASLRKPWFIECVHPYQSEFWKYVALSPWNTLTPTYKYHGWKRFTKHHLKRFIKTIVASKKMKYWNSLTLQ